MRQFPEPPPTTSHRAAFVQSTNAPPEPLRVTLQVASFPQVTHVPPEPEKSKPQVTPSQHLNTAPPELEASAWHAPCVLVGGVQEPPAHEQKGDAGQV